MKSLFLSFSIYFIFLVNNAQAYLDPGTGSIILQALLGAIAATASYVILDSVLRLIPGVLCNFLLE